LIKFIIISLVLTVEPSSSLRWTPPEGKELRKMEERERTLRVAFGVTREGLGGVKLFDTGSHLRRN